MTYTVEPSSTRSWTVEQLNSLFADGFPAFITADPEVKKHIGRVRECFPHLDLMLVDEAGQPAATGWGVPLQWSGTVADLPASFADVLGRAVGDHDSGSDPNTFVICGGVVDPGRKGTGTASELVRALREAGRTHGLARVIAPLRPTRKHQYPLFSIADYASWVRDDGLPFDPWLRLHVRLGGRVIALAETAQTMIGSVKEWEEWSGMALPATGDYVVPLGMNVLAIDVGADRGTYVEPNIWVRHV
jgi:GNAT superfamily N-acetyltransferase